jgi:hypothetical protein
LQLDDPASSKQTPPPTTTEAKTARTRWGLPVTRRR